MSWETNHACDLLWEISTFLSAFYGYKKQLDCHWFIPPLSRLPSLDVSLI
jgi:hypothetical protein